MMNLPSKTLIYTPKSDMTAPKEIQKNSPTNAPAPPKQNTLLSTNPQNPN